VTNESTSTNVSVTIDPNEHGDYEWWNRINGKCGSKSQYEKMKFGMTNLQPKRDITI